MNPDLASPEGVDALVAAILRDQFVAWTHGEGRPPNAILAVEEAERRIIAQCGPLLQRWALTMLHERYPIKRFPLDERAEAALRDAIG